MLNFEKSLDALEEMLKAKELPIDAIGKISEDERDGSVSSGLTDELSNETEIMKEINKLTKDNSYRIGLTRDEHSQVVVLASMMGKVFNKHVEKNISCKQIEKKFKINKILKNPLYYKLGFALLVVLLLFFKLSITFIILSSLILLVYTISLMVLMKNEKYIYHQVLSLKSSMNENLLEKKVNILELAYELVRTRSLDKNRLIKKRLRDNFHNYVEDYNKHSPNIESIKIERIMSYNDLFDAYKQSIHNDHFFFKLVLEDIQSYKNKIEKKMPVLD